MIWLITALIAVAGAEPSAELSSAADRVLEIWTPREVAWVVAADYSERRQEIEKRLNTKNLAEIVRIQINLAELKKCEQRKMAACLMAENLERHSAFVIYGDVLQTVRRAFVRSVKQNFFALGTHWGNQKGRADIADFIKDPLQEAVFILTDKSGKVVFNSSVVPFHFVRYGNVTEPTGRVVVREKGIEVSILHEDSRLDTLEFNGLGWVAHDFVQIKLEKAPPAIERAEIGECQPGSAISAVGYKDGELSLASGNVLNMSQFTLRAREWPHLIKFLRSLQGRTFLVTDLADQGHLDGGPLLDERGRVCGIVRDVRETKFLMGIPY